MTIFRLTQSETSCILKHYQNYAMFIVKSCESKKDVVIWNKLHVCFFKNKRLSEKVWIEIFFFMFLLPPREYIVWMAWRTESKNFVHNLIWLLSELIWPNTHHMISVECLSVFFVSCQNLLCSFDSISPFWILPR